MTAHAPSTAVVPNLAPMVDVIMVLLVFFLLGTSIEVVRQGVLQTELDPSSGPGAGQAIRVVPRVTIGLRDVEGGRGVQISVMGRELGENDFPGLFDYLRDRAAEGADRKNPLVIGAESTVRWQYVISAMDAATLAGFQNIQFAVSLRPSGSGP